MLSSVRFRRLVFYLLATPVVVLLVLSAANWGQLHGYTDVMGYLSSYLSQFGWIFIAFIVVHLTNAIEVPEVDFFDQIAESPIATAIFVGLLFLACAVAGPALAQSVCVDELSVSERRVTLVDTARADIGVTEHPPNSNEGERVETYLAHVGLGPGYPYCAAAATYWADAAGLEGPIGESGPFEGEPIQTALSAHYLTAQKIIPATRVLHGWDTVPCGSIGIYLRGNSRSGHTVVVAGDEQQSGCEWVGRCGKTIEANTTPSQDAPAVRQQEGGGVWPRTRCIGHGSFRLVAFAVPVE